MTARQAILAAMPGTTAQLIEQTRYCRSIVSEHTKALRDAGLSHIGAWGGTGKRPESIYAAGPGQDAPKPKRKTSTELTREYRARLASPAHVGPVGTVPAALMAQSRSFPLAGVWA